MWIPRGCGATVTCMAEERSEERTDERDTGADTPSDLDAMGNDKRRAVIGGQYGASKKKQLVLYAAALAVAAVVFIGGGTIVSNKDNAEIPLKDTAPWATAENVDEPRPIDFRANGPTDSIPVDEIVNR